MHINSAQRPDEEIDQCINYLYRQAELCEWNYLGI